VPATSRQTTLQALTTQLSEQRALVDSLTALLMEHETLVRSLTARLAEAESSVDAFSNRAVVTERKVAALTAQLEDREGTISSLSGQLSQKKRELEKITNTLGWRLLNAYGPFKYRYLLPIAGFLGCRHTAARKRKEQPGPAPTTGANSCDVNVASSRARPSTIKHAPTEQEFDELRRVLSLETNSYDVVCFPIIDWDFRSNGLSS
jgi:hypothetical protein